MDFHSFASSVTVVWKSVMPIRPMLFWCHLKSDLIPKGLHRSFIRNIEYKSNSKNVLLFCLLLIRYYEKIWTYCFFTWMDWNSIWNEYFRCNFFFWDVQFLLKSTKRLIKFIWRTLRGSQAYRFIAFGFTGGDSNSPDLGTDLWPVTMLQGTILITVPMCRDGKRMI